MNVECLLDTNVLVYAAAGRGRYEAKRQRAVEIVETEAFGLSAQVLQEFFVTVTTRIPAPLSIDGALEWIEQLEVFPCAIIDTPLVKVAAEVSHQHGIFYRDAAIVAAAETLGAKLLYTEELSDGQRYGSVVVRDPFR